MELTWLEKAEERAKETAVRDSVERLRRAVLRQIEQRFGAVPKKLKRRLEVIDSVEPLTEMIERILLVKSADELVASD